MERLKRKIDDYLIEWKNDKETSFLLERRIYEILWVYTRTTKS